MHVATARQQTGWPTDHYFRTTGPSLFLITLVFEAIDNVALGFAQSTHLGMRCRIQEPRNQSVGVKNLLLTIYGRSETRTRAQNRTAPKRTVCLVAAILRCEQCYEVTQGNTTTPDTGR